MSTLSISTVELSDEEQEKFSKVLKLYFPWLGTDEEDVCGSDAIEGLDLIFRALTKE